VCNFLSNISLLTFLLKSLFEWHEQCPLILFQTTQIVKSSVLLFVMSSTLPKVTIAIIGGGLIGPRHAQSVVKNPNATLIALVDPAPHGAQVATELNTNHYASVEVLIKSPHKPQAAIICTPNATHVALAKELAMAGIDILVEKPMSTDIPSGHSLIDHIKACGVKLLVGHHRRFNSYISLTKSILTSADPSTSLGRILAISGLWTAYKPASYFSPPTEWRQGSSGGVILINLIHEIDILHYLFGPIVRVHAEATPSTRGFIADEGSAIILRFASGAVGTFVVCDATPSPFSFEAGTGENPTIPRVGKDFYRVFGTQASLSVPDMTRFSYDGAEEKSWTQVLEERKIQVEDAVPFDRQVEHFVGLVRGDVREPMCSGEEGLRALVVCEAIRRAMETGSAVDVGDV
jgi:predicted dehydrogenase